MAVLREAPFGRLLTAMVTPFDDAGDLDLDGAAQLATELVDAGCHGIVVSGTTGEAATTSDAEKDAVLRAVVEAVGRDAHVLAGVGTNDTRHTIELARAAERSGADGLLAVTPYYSKPPQAGLLAHFTALADATGLPVMLYDIPGRSAVPIATETLLRLAEHPRVVAVKDAKGDLPASATVMAATDLAYYSGDDVATLPLLSIGAVGVVSVPAHVVGPQLLELIEAFDSGDLARARRMHHRLLPVFSGFFRTQAAILTKAALRLQRRPGGPVRLPLVDATAAEVEQLVADCAAAGVELAAPAGPHDLASTEVLAGGDDLPVARPSGRSPSERTSA